jgi:hypothetical protein
MYKRNSVTSPPFQITAAAHSPASYSRTANIQSKGIGWGGASSEKLQESVKISWSVEIEWLSLNIVNSASKEGWMARTYPTF